MSETNVVVFTGTVGTDVDSQVIPGSSKTVAKLSLANNKYKPNPQAESGFDQYTTWATVKFEGRVADGVVNKIQKGMKITVTGELSEDVWPDQNNPGKNHRKLYIFGHSFEIQKQAGGTGTGNQSGSRQNSGQAHGQQPGSNVQQSAPQAAPVVGNNPPGYNS
jgi:single stranded DNA-binding protein